MATVYIITAEADLSFLENQVLPVLPSNGYSHWVASFHLEDTSENAITYVMNQCQAIITVISKGLLQSSVFMNEVDIALKSKLPHIVMPIETINGKPGVPVQLMALPLVDLTLENKPGIKENLFALIPPGRSFSDTSIPDTARIIQWNESIFNQNLKEATARHDHARASELVSILTAYIPYLSEAYSTGWAVDDMQLLRQEREFKLMIIYGQAVIRSGARKDKLYRLFAQALIETKEYAVALEVLNLILTDPDSSQNEIFEARGLIGRTNKQIYMNNPSAEGSVSYLRTAIIAYGTTYLEDRNNFWHGVNAASCLLRLQRDGYEGQDINATADIIAKQIVEDLTNRAKINILNKSTSLSENGGLEVWDCASKVEALIIQEKYEEAKKALEVYLHHPDMTAFEVSSTYRQFDQVLQLDKIPEGVEILSLLRSSMERYRAGTVLNSLGSKSQKNKPDDESNLKALVIRLSDPSWQPKNAQELTIQSRLDKVVTAMGSNNSVRQLLDDPMIISVEASRPAGGSECNRSIPYININAQYSSPAGNYEENGSHALIAVIDDSIDILHQAFLDDNGSSRILGVWDQTDKRNEGVLGFEYGKFYSQDVITEYITQSSANTSISIIPPKLGRNGLIHGTHVASIAAGRKVGAFAGGVAPDAKLLIIIPGNSGSIGYSKSFIDALSFIDKFAEQKEVNLPVVVNVSQGMNAGAHDGKSALEAAFDAFSGSGRKAGRVVVKSAGNERNQSGHAKVTLLSGSQEELKWLRNKGAGFTERIEMWWSSADEFRFRLREPLDPLAKTAKPTPEWSEWIGTTNPKSSAVFSNGGPYCLTYTKRHIDNGDSLLEIELGQDVDAAAPAGVGEWLLEIESIDIRNNGEIHCWIERGQGGPPTTFRSHASEEMTLSIPGTAETVITVGAIDASKPIRVGAFSSYGPTRDNKQKPQVCAPGINVLAASAGTGTDVISDSGTSMAAPHVAGAIALLLSRASKTGRALNANQISKAICQKTQNDNRIWDRGQGYGVIDVAALLAAFE